MEISKPMTPLWPCEVKSQKEQISFQEGSIVQAKAPSTTHPLIDSTSCDPIPVRTLKDKCISSQVATERLTNYAIPLAVCLLKTYVISCPLCCFVFNKISSKTNMIESCPSDRRFSPDPRVHHLLPTQTNAQKRRENPIKMTMCIVSSSPPKKK